MSEQKRVSIAGIPVGDGAPCFLIAEIGINHNGDVDLACKLIDIACFAGWHAVKFQKRTVDVVYSPDELARPRESPFGTTNGDLKRGLEFGQKQYEQINRYCKEKKVLWSVSCWDEGSVDFIEQFDPPFHKVASASLTDNGLLRRLRKTKRPIVLSTGMSTIEQVDRAVEVLGTNDLILLHTTSAYPAKAKDLNLNMIPVLRQRYGVPVGYSGHEVGLATTYAAVALGACVVERHVTLDRSMWGTDQSASVEPQGVMRLSKDIRSIEQAMGDGKKRVSDEELAIQKKLRRVG